MLHVRMPPIVVTLQSARRHNQLLDEIINSETNAARAATVTETNLKGVVATSIAGAVASVTEAGTTTAIQTAGLLAAPETARTIVAAVMVVPTAAMIKTTLAVTTMAGGAMGTTTGLAEILDPTITTAVITGEKTKTIVPERKPPETTTTEGAVRRNMAAAKITAKWKIVDRPQSASGGLIMQLLLLLPPIPLLQPVLAGAVAGTKICQLG